MTEPLFASALSTEADFGQAFSSAATELEAQLGGRAPDLALAFVSHHHGPAMERLGSELALRTRAKHVLACTGESIVGGTREIESGAGLALFAGVLPKTVLRPFRVGVVQSDETTFGFSGGPDVRDPARASILLFADPYAFPAREYLELQNERLPGVPVIGGMASGGSGPGQNFLWDADGLVEEGAVGIVIEGAIEVASIVSQGCRPVGHPYVITGCKENLIHKLGGKPAVQALLETLETLTPDDRQLLQSRPFLGLALDARKQSFERGDFLVRGLIGIEPKSSALAVGDDAIRPGMTVQFLVRDAATASEDLVSLTRQRAGQHAGSPSSMGALLFSCNGRGSRMFASADHDIGCVQTGLAGAGAVAEPVPAAGFFAAGEIGPIGGRNFLHGFTASVALFRARG